MGANDHDILYDDGSSATVMWKSVKVDTETGPPTLRPVPRMTQVMAPTQDPKVEVTLWGQALAFVVPSGVPSGELFSVRFMDESYPPGTTMSRASYHEGTHEGTKGYEVGTPLQVTGLSGQTRTVQVPENTLPGDWIPVAAGGSYPMESASSAISTPSQYVNPLNDQLPDPEAGAIEAPAAVELKSEQAEGATGNNGGGEGQSS